jgi:hypothetical protein
MASRVHIYYDTILDTRRHRQCARYPIIKHGTRGPNHSDPPLADTVDMMRSVPAASCSCCGAARPWVADSSELSLQSSSSCTAPSPSLAAVKPTKALPSASSTSLGLGLGSWPGLGTGPGLGLGLGLGLGPGLGLGLKRLGLGAEHLVQHQPVRHQHRIAHLVEVHLQLRAALEVAHA